LAAFGLRHSNWGGWADYLKLMGGTKDMNTEGSEKALFSL